MPELIGLEKFRKKFVIKRFCHSVSAHLVDLKKHGFATSAGDYGAINVWKGNDGIFRGRRMVYFSEKSFCETPKLSVLKNWLMNNFPMIVQGSRGPILKRSK